MTKVAAVQMVSTPVVSENIETARRLIGEAAQPVHNWCFCLNTWPSIALNDAERTILPNRFVPGPSDFIGE